jgi:hypothetical protein
MPYDIIRRRQTGGPSTMGADATDVVRAIKSMPEAEAVTAVKKGTRKTVIKASLLSAVIGFFAGRYLFPRR